MEEIFVTPKEFDRHYNENKDDMYKKHGYLPVYWDLLWIDQKTGRRVVFREGGKKIVCIE